MNLEQGIRHTLNKKWGEKSAVQWASKLSEECGEVCGAINKIPEGRATPQDVRDEIGDVLIVLSAMADHYNTSLEHLRTARWRTIAHRCSLLETNAGPPRDCQFCGRATDGRNDEGKPLCLPCRKTPPSPTT